MSELMILGISFVVGVFNSASFLASFVQAQADQVVWALAGFAFEVFKTSVWRKAQKSMLRILGAVFLSLVTLIASVGQIYLSLERTRLETERTTQDMLSSTTGTELLIETRDKLATKLREDTGPQTSVTIAGQLESMIKTAASLQQSTASHRLPTGLEIVSGAMQLVGLNGVLVMVTFFGLLFLTFEITTIAYVRNEDVFEPVRWKWRWRRSQKAFIKVAEMTNGELRGRREIEALGWHPAEVRRQVELLKVQGRAVAQGRGRRLRLIGPPKKGDDPQSLT